MELKVVKAGTEKKYELAGISRKKIALHKEAIRDLGATNIESVKVPGVWGYYTATLTFYSKKSIKLASITSMVERLTRISEVVALQEAVDGLVLQIKELQVYAHTHNKPKDKVEIIGLTKETEYAWK